MVHTSDVIKEYSAAEKNWDSMPLFLTNGKVVSLYPNHLIQTARLYLLPQMPMQPIIKVNGSRY